MDDTENNNVSLREYFEVLVKSLDRIFVEKCKYLNNLIKIKTDNIEKATETALKEVDRRHELIKSNAMIRYLYIGYILSFLAIICGLIAIFK